jgi:hypothetical protein
MRPQTTIATAILLLAALTATPARAAEPLAPRAESPSPRFNRLHDYEEMTGILRAYARAYPEWVKLESIGKSLEGRDIWLLTVNNPATGPDRSKPAMYIDGNIHANEVQGAETALYTVDFVLANYGRLDRVTELADRIAFYVIPMVNPDGRARWFTGPSTAHFPRTVMVPVDDDRDGLVDEDGYDDLDGDGVITQMRKKVALGEGSHRLHPKDPRIMVAVEPGELGDYRLPRQRRHRQRRRRPSQRGPGRVRRPEPDLGLLLDAALRPGRRGRLPAPDPRDPLDRPLGPRPPEHRRRPELSQQRPDDPPRSGSEAPAALPGT